jgi:hypothetical protein
VTRSTLRLLAPLAAGVAALGLAACETISAGLAPGAGDAALERRLAEAEARNDALAREVATLRAADGAAGPPAGVEPGRCYARIPPATSAERRLIEPERRVARITPAIYEWRDERVLVREARTEYEVAPAVVETVFENVLVSEGYTERTVMPARYAERSAPGTLRDGYVRFESCPVVGASSEATLCAAEQPARMGTVTERVLVEPERVRETDIPSRYMRVRRELVREPARLVTREIPAEYETLRVQRLVEPAREEMVAMPAVYAQADDAGGAGGWVEVLCDTSENRPVVQAVQRALAAAGGDPGPIDGMFGPRTRAAMLAYQREHGLASGHLTRETAERLGVAWP